MSEKKIGGVLHSFGFGKSILLSSSSYPSINSHHAHSSLFPSFLLPVSSFVPFAPPFSSYHLPFSTPGPKKPSIHQSPSRSRSNKKRKKKKGKLTHSGSKKNPACGLFGKELCIIGGRSPLYFFLTYPAARRASLGEISWIQFPLSPSPSRHSLCLDSLDLPVDCRRACIGRIGDKHRFVEIGSLVLLHRAPCIPSFFFFFLLK